MTNKIYVARETEIKFTASGGDVVLTLDNLASDVARISAQKDLGAGSKSQDYNVRIVIEFDSTTAPVLGESVDVYISTSDGIDPDGQEGVADANVGTNESLKNMIFIGSLIVTSTDVDHQMTASFVCRITTRYFSVVVHNNTADLIDNTANASWVIVTPIPSEIQ